MASIPWQTGQSQRWLELQSYLTQGRPHLSNPAHRELLALSPDLLFLWSSPWRLDPSHGPQGSLLTVLPSSILALHAIQRAFVSTRQIISMKYILINLRITRHCREKPPHQVEVGQEQKVLTLRPQPRPSGWPPSLTVSGTGATQSFQSLYPPRSPGPGENGKCNRKTQVFLRNQAEPAGHTCCCRVREGASQPSRAI